MKTSRMDLDENVCQLQNRNENYNANATTNAMVTAIALLVLHTRELTLVLMFFTLIFGDNFFIFNVCKM